MILSSIISNNLDKIINVKANSIIIKQPYKYYDKLNQIYANTKLQFKF